MIHVSEIRGLRYPDDMVIKHFFKAGLDKTHGRVLELGCGNGNNLMLYQAFGWDLFGVDVDVDALLAAQYNLGGEHHLIPWNLRAGLPPGLPGEPYDALVMSHVLTYLSIVQAADLLKQVKPLLAPGAHVFYRGRTPADYRYRQGFFLGDYTCRIDFDLTGEKGHVNRFYHDWEVAQLFRTYLGIQEFVALDLNCDHTPMDSGKVIWNDDHVAWGRLPQ